MDTVNLEETVLNLRLGDIIQQFTEEELQREMPVFMQDIDAETKELIDTYQAYLSEGNFSDAQAYRASHPALETRIWDSFKANSLLAYAAFSYLYAKDKKQQCILSETPPPSGNGEDIIGQVEGDIWFRIDEIKDGIVNTTPFQKQADGSYAEFAVAPKLEFATAGDIDTLFDENTDVPDNAEYIINKNILKYYNEKLNTVLAELNSGWEEKFIELENRFSTELNRKLGEQVTYSLKGTTLTITPKSEEVS